MAREGVLWCEIGLRACRNRNGGSARLHGWEAEGSLTVTEELCEHESPIGIRGEPDGKTTVARIQDVRAMRGALHQCAFGTRPGGLERQCDRQADEVLPGVGVRDACVLDQSHEPEGTAVIEV